MLVTVALAFAAPLVDGYHYGLEDQFIYLPAIKKHLNPALYPFDSIIFQIQTKLTLFDEIVAWSVKATRLHLDTAVFLWHVLSIFLILFASLKLARRCFPGPLAQWAAVLSLWAALVAPVAGTQLTLTDLYLQPRDLATGLLLFGLVAVLDRSFLALLWIALAAIIHPIMAVCGAFHLAVQAWHVPRKRVFLTLLPVPVVGWLGHVQNSAWHEALATRRFLFPARWYWYEWLDVIACFAMLVWFAYLARTRRLAVAEHVCGRAVIAGTLGVLGSFVITTVPAFERFIPCEPMRTLHFVHVLWVFFAGGMLAEFVFRRRPLLLVVWVTALAVIFYSADRSVYRSSPHVEWPGSVAQNPWCEAYAWVRLNTPTGAVFMLNPMYFTLPEVDGHSFRALADRSRLFDWWQDRGVAATWPGFARDWQEQTRDLKGWPKFTLDDFHRLQQKYGASWIMADRHGAVGQRLLSAAEAEPSALACPYENTQVLVCQMK